MPHFVELAEDKHGNFLVQRASECWQYELYSSRFNEV